MLKPNIFTETKGKTEEQRDLSMLLLKLLYEIYNKIDLEIDCDEDTAVVSAYYVIPKDTRSSEEAHLPTKMRLYDIWHETYSDKTQYWLRVQNGNRQMVEFGRFQNDGTCFSDNEYDYLEALYNLPQRTCVEKRSLAVPSAKTRAALSTLKHTKAKPNLKSTEAWNKTRMAVFPYLKNVLEHKK